MLQLFRNSNLVTLIPLGFLTLLLNLPQLLRPAEMQLAFNTPLGKMLEGMLQTAIPEAWVQVLLAIFLIFLQAIFFNQVLIKHIFFQKSTFLPGFFYVVICSLFKESVGLTGILLTNTIFIWIFDKYCEVYKTDRPIQLIFELGLLFGFCSMIALEYLVLFLTLPFFILFNRKLNIREFIIAALGFTLPYYFMLLGYYFRDNLEWLRDRYIDVIFEFAEKSGSITLPEVAILVIFSLLTFFALLHLQSGYFSKPVKLRKIYQILIFCIAADIGMFYLGRNYFQMLFIILAVPTAILLADLYYLRSRTFIKDLSFYLMLITSISIKFFFLMK